MRSPVPRLEKTGASRTLGEWGPALCSWLVDVAGAGAALRRAVCGGPRTRAPPLCVLSPSSIAALGHQVLSHCCFPSCHSACLGGSPPPRPAQRHSASVCALPGTNLKGVCASLLLPWDSWGRVFRGCRMGTVERLGPAGAH